MSISDRVRRLEAALSPGQRSAPVVAVKAYIGLGPSAWQDEPMNTDASKGYIEVASLAELAGLGESEVVESAHSDKD